MAIAGQPGEGLCIDTTRVFATGFSFGGMITYSLSTNHQKQIRAAVGMGDRTTPWVNGSSTTQGAKFIAIEKAADNGCTLPANLPIW